MTEQSNASRDPFGLAALPHPVPADDGWPHIRAALQRRQQTRRATVWLASAAVIMLAAGIYWQLPVAHMTGELTSPVAVTATPSDTVSGPAADNLESLVRLSQKLERSLRNMRAEVGVMQAQPLIYQVQLEDMVSQIDEAINQQPDSLELWSQRVNLLLDLNQLYEQQMRREYPRIASL